MTDVPTPTLRASSPSPGTPGEGWGEGSRWRRIFRRFIFLAVVLVIWQGDLRRLTGPAEGAHLNGPASSAAPAMQNLRVASFNIAGGVAPDDNRLDLARTARYLAGFDLIGMQEVHGANLFQWHDQAELLGQQLHMPWLFAPSETQWFHAAFGNAALCRLPVSHWKRVPLSMAPDASNRSLLYLTVQWHNKNITVLITHLDRHVDHRAELGAIVTAFMDAPPPAILMGDLNMVERDARFDAMRADPAVSDAVALGVGPKIDPL